MDHLLGAYGDIDIEDEEDETEAMTLVTPDQSPQKRKKEEEGRTAAASGPPTANKKHKSKGNRGGASSSSSVQLPSVIFESDGQPSSFAAPTYSAPPPMQLVEPPADYQTTPKRKYAGRGASDTRMMEEEQEEKELSQQFTPLSPSWSKSLHP